MNELKVFRHEFKYNIDKKTMYNIRDKLSQVLDVDRNIDGYIVRSLYFDSINDMDYYQKQNGDIKRKKIRLRIYDPEKDFVKLEIKQKYDIHQLKETLVIDKDTAKKLINGEYSVLLNYDSDIARKIYYIMATGHYLPKCVIEYKRIAFVSKNNTRITLDYDIKSYKYVDDVFFDNRINYIDLINKSETVLEVKFDRFLENYISKVLSNNIFNNQSISKYVMGRKI